VQNERPLGEEGKVDQSNDLLKGGGGTLGGGEITERLGRHLSTAGITRDFRRKRELDEIGTGSGSKRTPVGSPAASTKRTARALTSEAALGLDQTLLDQRWGVVTGVRSAPQRVACSVLVDGAWNLGWLLMVLGDPDLELEAVYFGGKVAPPPSLHALVPVGVRWLSSELDCGEVSLLFDDRTALNPLPVHWHPRYWVRSEPRRARRAPRGYVVQGSGTAGHWCFGGVTDSLGTAMLYRRKDATPFEGPCPLVFSRSLGSVIGHGEMGKRTNPDASDVPHGPAVVFANRRSRIVSIRGLLPCLPSTVVATPCYRLGAGKWVQRRLTAPEWYRALDVPERLITPLVEGPGLKAFPPGALLRGIWRLCSQPRVPQAGIKRSRDVGTNTGGGFGK